MILKQDLQKKRFVLDGALGTQLEAIIPRDSPFQPRSSPLWSGLVLLHQPELVSRIHCQYVESGADAVITATYQISRASLKRHTELNDQEIVSLWKQAVDVAHKASEMNRDIYVFGSIGPYATFLADGSEYTGNYGDISLEELINYHEPLSQYLASDEKVAALAFETIPNFEEFKAILEVVVRNNFTKSFYTSFNFADSTKLVDGTDISLVIEYLNQFLAKNLQLSQRFLGLGINCVDCEIIESIIESINGLTKQPLIVYPNLGFDFDVTLGQYLAKKKGEKWIKLVRKWCEFDNVRIIGGCCGTLPLEIRQVKEVVGP